LREKSRGVRDVLHRKIAAKIKAGKPSTDAIAKLIAEEFEELNP